MPRSLSSLFLTIALLSGAVVAQAPEVGTPAPKFTADAHDGSKVMFPVKDRWSVLAFYPKAATPG